MKPNRNGLLAGALAAVVAGMVGLSVAAVRLYRAFCAATGYGGTPNITAEAGPGATKQMIEVRFNANTNPGLPWKFWPEVSSVRVPLGAEELAAYRARNLGDKPVTGVAIYNVTPDKVGKYFHKTACFCFDEQILAAGAEQEFPLSFWVDPAIATDPNTADVHSITLSYTFFHALDDAVRIGALAKAGPHVGPLVR